MLDAKTLILCTGLINYYMLAGLYFYGKNQKTYPGFRHWITALGLVAFAYTLFLLRGIAPDFLTIPVANTIVMFSAIFRIEGVKRFIGQTKFNYWNLWMPALTFAWYSYFTVIEDNISLRNALFTLITIYVVARVGRLLLANPHDKKKHLSYFFIIILSVYSTALIVRAAAMFLDPASQTLTANTPVNVIYFLCALLADISWSIIFVLLHVQRINTELETATAQLAQEHERQTTTQVTALENQRKASALEERERLGHELHDGLGQIMAYFNVQSQAIQQLIATGQVESAKENLARLTQMAQEAQAEIRSYILHLKGEKPLNKPGGLYEMIQTRLDEFGQLWNIETRLLMPRSTALVLPEIVEDQVLRILQEALANIRKHAQARRIDVTVSNLSNELLIIIGDDGVGYDKAQITQPESHHFGVGFMRARAMQIGGRLDIQSKPGAGTQVILSIPNHYPGIDDEADREYFRSYRVLLVDDHPMFIDGLNALVTARGMTVIGLARDGIEAQEQARALRPDLILMDVDMPRCNGLEATRAIKSEHPGIKIVMLTVSENEDTLYEALRSGASGYLLKNMDANEFYALLTGLARGETILPNHIAARIIGEFNRRGEKRAPEDTAPKTTPGISTQQWAILEQVAEGRTYKEIGAALNISEKTVKYHMGQILNRMHLKNRAEAIAFMKQQKN